MPACAVCNDTGLVMEDTGGSDPEGRFIEVPAPCPECSVCHCGMLLKDHTPRGSCTSPQPTPAESILAALESPAAASRVEAALNEYTRALIHVCSQCGGTLERIKLKLVCSQCHRIVETCCEGDRG